MVGLYWGQNKKNMLLCFEREISERKKEKRKQKKERKTYMEGKKMRDQKNFKKTDLSISLHDSFLFLIFEFH